MASKIRLNFHTESEATINKQINLELHASYVYMAMVSLKTLKYLLLFVFLKRSASSGLFRASTGKTSSNPG